MAVQVASLTAFLDLDKRKFDAGLKGASSGLNSFGSSIGGAMAALGAVGAAVGAFSVVTNAIGGMVSAAREAIAVEKELTQVILASNGIAGVSVQTAKDYAAALTLVTNFTDDAIIATESMLLTYTNISKDVFPAALESGLDLAQFFKMEGPAAAKIWGKALNDPAKGLNTLTRMGVTFTDQQKAMVKAMMAVNDTAGAQRVMIDAVASQGIGGQARAMADPFIQVGNAIGEIQETLGMGLMPMLLAAAKEVLPALQNAAKELSPSLGELGIALGKDFGRNLAEIIGMVVTLANQFGGMIDAAGKLGAALGLGGEAAQGFNVRLLPLKITFGLLGGIFGIVAATLESVAFVIDKVGIGWTLLNSEGGRLNQIGASLTATWTSFTSTLASLWASIVRVTSAWTAMLTTMGQQPAHPDLTPGSPTPLEMGLRGIGSAVRAMPALPTMGASGGLGGGMVPMASGGGGNVTNNTYLQIGSQSFGPFTGSGGSDEAIRTVLQQLRQNLDR